MFCYAFVDCFPWHSTTRADDLFLSFSSVLLDGWMEFLVFVFYSRERRLIRDELKVIVGSCGFIGSAPRLIYDRLHSDIETQTPENETKNLFFFPF